jgi:hypothetical protein
VVRPLSARRSSPGFLRLAGVVRRVHRGYLTEDLAHAKQGVHSALKAGLWSISASRKFVIHLLTFDESDAVSHDEGLGSLLAFGGMVGSGPPAFRNRQLLARVLVDAWMRNHDLGRTGDDLMASLVQAGRARPYTRLAPDGTPRASASPDIDPVTSRLVRADGSFDVVHLVGIPVDDARGTRVSRRTARLGRAPHPTSIRSRAGSYGRTARSTSSTSSASRWMTHAATG